MSRSRQPRGVPTGGQFTEHPHEDADASINLGNPFVATAVLDEINTAAARTHRRYHSVDAEEIASDVSHRVMRSYQKAKTKDAPLEVEGVRAAWIQKIANNAAYDRAHGNNTKALAATKRLNVLRRQQEDRLGRSLSEAEYDDIAEEVRQGITPRRRPGPGYHRVASEQSLESRAERGAWLPSCQDEYLADDDADAYDRVVEARANATNSATEMWEAWSAAHSESPRVVAPYMSLATATRRRRQIVTTGGLHAAIDAWSDETLTPRQTHALFSPFSKHPEQVSYADQERIVAMFNQTPSREAAQALWESAVSAVTRR